MNGGEPTASLALSLDRERAVASRTRTLVVGAYRRDSGGNIRSHTARMEEARGLAAAIDLSVVGDMVALVDRPRPATLLGKGKVVELARRTKDEGIGLVVVDAALTPVQQRNLEKALATKVIDRTGLILEIFGRRARTREGALQVELAHLAYQRGRLVRSWTHLERQRGGFGFMGGPGETQIEADRRLIQDRIRRLEREIEEVKRTRGLHRAARNRVPYPSVALVGYTNAGKSTLFNRLTAADVLAKDMLFATLDPTTRLVRLAPGVEVVLADTVGFISDLPTTLVAAFRATLEDVVAADIVLHVRDVAHADSEAQAEDVSTILRDLGFTDRDGPAVIEVWNKADQLSPEDHFRLTTRMGMRDDVVLVSALTGEGIPALAARLLAHIVGARPIYTVQLPPDDGQGLAWLHEHGEVLARHTISTGEIVLKVRVRPEREWPLVQRFPSARRGEQVTGAAARPPSAAA